MGLALDSFENIFSFLKKHPSVILLASIPSLLSSFIPPILTFPLEISLLFKLQSILRIIAQTVILITILIVISLIVIGAYPITVYQAVRRGKVEIRKAIQKSSNMIPKIFITVLLLALIVTGPIGLCLLGYFLFPVFLFLLFTFVFIFLGVYLSLRLFLTIPILVLEGKNPLESLEKSWKITKNNLISILALIVLIGLTATLISFPLNILKAFFGVLNTSYIYLILDTITSTINGAISYPAAAIYYINLKKSKLKF